MRSLRLAFFPLLPLAPFVFSLACGHSAPTPAHVATSASSFANASSSAPAPSTSASAAPSIAPPVAIEGTLPSDARAARFDRSIECTTTPRCAHPDLLPPGDRPEESAPAFFWEERFAKGKGLAFPRVAEVDLLGVVLDGEVTLQGDEEPAKSARKLAPWSAFRAPGAGITLGGGGRLVLLAATRDGGPLAKLVSDLGRNGAAHAWKTRARAIDVIDLAAAPSLDWGGGAYHARLGFEAGEGAAASLGVLIASKDAPVKEHVHEHEWELMAVLDGEGDLIERPLSGERRTHVEGPRFLAVPPDEPHGWAPTGARPLIAIQAYAPPGPEQRFKKLAGVGKPGG
jgi:mannose-6-phosphate isomerase-like protein (cupin superfamily)